MASFNGIDISTWGIFNLGGGFRRPKHSRQKSIQTAPGINGAFILIGGVNPQSFRIGIQLRGISGSDFNEAHALILTIETTIRGLVGTTGDFIDDDNTIWTNSTLDEYEPVSGLRYNREGADYVVSFNCVLRFLRAVT